MTRERLEEIKQAYRKGWQGFDDILMVGELLTALEEAWAQLEDLKKYDVRAVGEIIWNCGDHITAPGSKTCLTCGMEVNDRPA